MTVKYKLFIYSTVIPCLFSYIHNANAYDYWETKKQIEDEENNVAVKKIENTYLKMVWGQEITKKEFENLEKKSFKDINGASLDDIENKKFEEREIPTDTSIYTIMNDNIILKNKQMFVSEGLQNVVFRVKYICQSGLEVKEGTSTYMDQECYKQKQQKYTNCGLRGDEGCIRSIAMMGQHYFDDCQKKRETTYETCNKAIGLGYINDTLVAVIPYDNFEWPQSLTDIPVDVILKKLADNYGKPDYIIKRNFSSMPEECQTVSSIMRQNRISMPFSCDENTESYFWINKPWVQTIEISYDNNNKPISITRSLVNWGNYQALVEKQKEEKAKALEDRKKQQEEQQRKIEEEKQQKINNFNI
ncbi:MAG: cell envelope integrity protein TolA [Alphaproteobacteria bacterium]|nr:cell envelope integrity protein TolA [Alphaproteobacteria bacterium]